MKNKSVLLLLLSLVFTSNLYASNPKDLGLNLTGFDCDDKAPLVPSYSSTNSTKDEREWIEGVILMVHYNKKATYHPVQNMNLLHTNVTKFVVISTEGDVYPLYEVFDYHQFVFDLNNLGNPKVNITEDFWPLKFTHYPGKKRHENLVSYINKKDVLGKHIHLILLERFNLIFLNDLDGMRIKFQIQNDTQHVDGFGIFNDYNEEDNLSASTYKVDIDTVQPFDG